MNVSVSGGRSWRDGLGNRIGPPEFGPDLVRKYQVSGVPKTVVNETVDILGARPEEDFVRTAVGGANPPSAT